MQRLFGTISPLYSLCLESCRLHYNYCIEVLKLSNAVVFLRTRQGKVNHRLRNFTGLIRSTVKLSSLASFNINRCICRSLLQIFSLGLTVYHVKHRLRAEPPSFRGPDCLVRERGVSIVNLDSLTPSARCRRIRKQLGIAAFLQTDKPKDGFFNAAADSEEAVVLQQRRLLTTQFLRNIPAFFLGQNNPVKLFVHDVVLGIHVLVIAANE